MSGSPKHQPIHGGNNSKSNSPKISRQRIGSPLRSLRSSSQDEKIGRHSDHPGSPKAMKFPRMDTIPPRMVPSNTSPQLSQGTSNEIGMDVVYLPEDRPIIPGCTVRAATIEKLLEKHMDCFDNGGKLAADTEYPHVLLLMHKWFISSEDLAQKYIDLFSHADSIPCEINMCSHRYPNHSCPRVLYKTKTCYAVRYWIDHFPVHFFMDSQLTQVISNFVQNLIKLHELQLKELVDLTKIPSYDWMRHISVRNPSQKLSQKTSLVFNHLQPNELAEQLTFLEYKAFRRITFADFHNYAIQASLKDNPKLARSISLFNGLSQWVQCMVLSKTTPQERANVMVKFVNVAKRLHQLQNFNSLMAVVGGLCHSALARLAKTNACLPSDTQKILNEYTELLSSSNNFSNYRKALHNARTGFRVPILGVHLKDLILLHTALPDKIGNGLVNFRKMAQLSVTFSELMHVQNTALNVDVNMDLVSTLRLSLDLHYTEDEIYELSLAREPRNSVSSPSTPTKPVMFGDWVAGLTPPDPDTINKHVHAMVEAVYKNYDHDRDGFICQSEFEAIAGNFPFIDSFCVLDADQDGMISKAEMETYFIRANSHALRNSFKHNFHETTYFKPTFCILCTGLLWGIIKQGWKCKDCGINAHKHCKDLVVMECRSRTSVACHGRTNSVSNDEKASGTSTPPISQSGTCSSPYRPVNRNVTLQKKRKMSQRLRRTRATRAVQTDVSPSSSPLCGRANTNMNLQDDITEDVDKSPDDTTKALYEKLVKCKKHREGLLAENQTLKEQISAQNDQISTLKSHIGAIRQETITFILDQMDTLNIQRDTEV
ncbi:ras guanyl-releasing protein 3-like [Tubulanus polymorphus]|uniref:ras guanyl-releasing protein 3-like n=1 Tax=Tubulanus polymorphus TaxID=672921 RepID=UPI003DA4DC1B